MKTIYRLIIFEATRDLKDPDKIGSHKTIVCEDYDEVDEALVIAKNTVRNKMFEEDNDSIYTRWLVDDIDDVTVDKLLGDGMTYYMEIRDDHTNNYYEGYACIKKHDITIKDKFEEVFGWFLVFLFWPVELVMATIRLSKIRKKYSVDVIERYRDELKITPISKWAKVYDKYFEEEL